jgi:hypothetical protein
MILFVCTSLNWISFLVVLCGACGGVNIWIGATHLLEGFPVEYWLCGIDRRVVEKIEECVGEYTVSCSFRNVKDGFSWAFAGVYGPNTNCNRKYLWEELAVVWKMVPPWRERNDISFQDRERMSMELKSFFFNILYI